jgi:hypothetical protein
LFGWLLAAAIFSAIYRPARSGRKVAYLTVTSFAVLAVSIGVSLSLPSEHGGERQKAESKRQKIESVDRSPVAFCILHSAFCIFRSLEVRA